MIKRDPYESLIAAWSAEGRSATFDRHFEAWQERCEDFAKFDDAECLITWFQDPAVPYDEKQPVALELCLLTQAGDRSAGALLGFLFLPAFKKAAESKTQRTVHQDDFVGEILVAFWESVLTVTRDTHRVCGYLANGAVNKAITARRRAIRIMQTETSLQEISEKSEAILGVTEDLPSGMGDERHDRTPADVLVEAERQKVINENEALLIRATRLDGFPLDRTAHVLGMTYSAAAEARRRAEARVAAWLKGRDVPARRNISPRVEIRRLRALRDLQDERRDEASA